LVEIGVVRLEPRNPTPALQQGINRAEGVFNDLLHTHEAAANALLGKLEDLRFGVVENVFGKIALLGGAGNGCCGGVNQAAQQRLVTDNLDVVLNAGTIGNAVEQARQIGIAANGFELALAIEFLCESDLVN